MPQPIYWLISIADVVDTDLRSDQLGASPAELDGDVEQGRQHSWHSHDGEAELRLNDTVYDC